MGRGPKPPTVWVMRPANEAVPSRLALATHTTGPASEIRGGILPNVAGMLLPDREQSRACIKYSSTYQTMSLIIRIM